MQPIIVGYDDSPPARATLEWTAREASLRHASVLVVYAWSPVREWTLTALQIDTDRLRTQVRRNLRGRWTQRLRAHCIPFETRLVPGRPGPALLRVARSTNAACIVIGADRRHAVVHRNHGPVARFVQRHARRPVISVPPNDMQPPPAASEAVSHVSRT